MDVGVCVGFGCTPQAASKVAYVGEVLTLHDQRLGTATEPGQRRLRAYRPRLAACYSGPSGRQLSACREPGNDVQRGWMAFPASCGGRHYRPRSRRLLKAMDKMRQDLLWSHARQQSAITSGRRRRWGERVYRCWQAGGSLPGSLPG
jgi:hypothetical protein